MSIKKKKNWPPKIVAKLNTLLNKKNFEYKYLKTF